MNVSVRARLRDLAESRPLLVLAVAGLVTATAAAASPLKPSAARTDAKTALERAVAQIAPPVAARPARLTLVWEGKDIDGDGRADFANPTGHAARGHDAYGEGEFGARRDGGSRRHEGVDFVARAGQVVAAPLSGYVTKIGYAYAGDQTLKFVEVTNPALQYAARIFYVNPKVEVGEAVAIGKPIGTAHSLQSKYPGGMTNHVHLELIDRKGQRIDATRMITAEYVPADAATTVAMGD